MKRIRVVFCGDLSVGKSSIIKRFATGSFNEFVCETVAGVFHSQFVRLNGETISLEIWDTAGAERYHSVIPAFFKNAAAVVVVYDITARSSFDAVPYWISFSRQNAPEGARIFLAGNKTDLFAVRAVAYDEGVQCRNSNQFVAFTETSAKTGEEIDNLFALLADVPPNGLVDAQARGEVISLDRRKCC
jgi:small GTP-binding protein